ncbi:guanine nucleotide exchange factor MSS4 homolog [Teleopsis dalmanni]|uniref:guanine nucleotide exchange factor MSS4 homolog n=1 Tax=Teleopsis dalmanni TaxID=139649 RepID=UPI0018CC9743|nr:guanine nucleotide exchange factor MSS4 homolog [Teleopsis dalmanni]XP_037927967.1 guanine nucleotide exchange factor MSS4 homolog [Teleopsis dalmanni]
MSDDAVLQEEISDNKNRNEVRCVFCNSLMLREKQGEYVEETFELPLVHQKHAKDIKTIETEKHHHFWLVYDMFHFENIGFSNTVDTIKYLICADCDMGPVGYHDIENKKCYIALKRVRHGNAPPDVAAIKSV